MKATVVPRGLGHAAACAFAVDAERHLVIGLITAYDISGERPMRLMQSQKVKRGALLVRDLMQPLREWRVLNVEDLERATVLAPDEASKRVHIAEIHMLRALCDEPIVKRAKTTAS